MKTPISKRLKELRSEFNLSQKRLGMRASFSPFSANSRINQYEQEKREPDFKTLKAISAVLKVDPSYFFAENDELAEIIKEWSRNPV